ncbi:MAG TPA: glycoside hydrolase family 31 protein [Symbiobacteriaceae bacterium]
MERLHGLAGWYLKGRTLVLDAGWEGKLCLTPALPGVVEVRLRRGSPWSQEPPVPSVTVDPARWPDLPPPRVEDRGDHLMVFVEGAAVRVDKSPLRLHFWAPGPQGGAAGEPLLSDAPEGGVEMDGWQVGVRFRLTPEDHFFGLGQPDQRQGPIPLDHRGRRYPIWHKHLPAPSRMVLPVLVSLRGYGLFVDNPWPAEWDLGTDGATFGYRAQAGQLVYYFIAGPALTTVLDRYTRLVGRPSLAPRWAFGFLQSKFGYRTQEEVEGLAAAFRERQIPLSGIVLDLFWFRHMGDLAFNRAAFPDPAGLIRHLREQGVRVIVIEEPYLTVDSRLYPEAERLGLLGMRPDGGPYVFPFWAGRAALVDFTQPLACQWWADRHKPLMDLGIAGWWADLNEPEVHPPDMVHHGGVAAAVHNLYALLMIRSVAMAHEQHRPDMRLFIMSRAGWPGTQALGACHWSGDVATTWEALAHQPVLGLCMGMSGMPYWNSDIGGFAGEPPSPELFVRWIQFGTFTPVMRPHGSHQDREPWAFGPEAEAIVRRYIRLRYRLLPYTYTLAWEAHRQGLPFMRPLVLHYPRDPKCLTIRDQYLWGRDLLVAPVTAPGQQSRPVYLPEGDWYDFWTGRRIRGGRWIQAPAPLETLPLFVRAGAILPEAPWDRSQAPGWEELTLNIYPGPEVSEFLLYEDDGETMAFARGEYATIRFTYRPAEGGGLLTIDPPQGAYAGMPPVRRYRAAIRLPRRPRRVTVDGTLLTPRRSRETLERFPTGWWYDRQRKVLYVRLPPVSGGLSLKVQ